MAETSIFISHSHRDAKLAKELDDILSSRDIPASKVFRSQKIKKGEAWRPAILEALRESNVFLLLYTRPGHDWEWCHTEAGVFMGVGEGSIICIHKPGEMPPRTLEHVQSVPATGKDIRAWLVETFEGPEVDLAALRAAAEKIERAFDKHALSQTGYQFRSRFSLKDLEGLGEGGTLPYKTMIEAGNGTVFDHLGYGAAEDEVSWETLKDIDDFGETNDRWARQMAQALHDISKGELSPVVEEPLTNAEGKKYFRTTFLFADRGSSALEVVVLFVEEMLDSPLQPVAKKLLDRLAVPVAILRHGKKYDEIEVCFMNKAYQGVLRETPPQKIVDIVYPALLLVLNDEDFVEATFWWMKRLQELVVTPQGQEREIELESRLMHLFDEGGRTATGYLQPRITPFNERSDSPYILFYLHYYPLMLLDRLTHKSEGDLKKEVDGRTIEEVLSEMVFPPERAERPEELVKLRLAQCLEKMSAAGAPEASQRVARQTRELLTRYHMLGFQPALTGDSDL